MKIRNMLMITAAAAALTAVPAFASAEDLTGEWYLSTIGSGDMSMNAADMGLTLTMTLNEDGSASMLESDGTETVGTWNYDEEGGLLSVDGDFQMAYEDDLITLTMPDDQYMVFSREMPEGELFEFSPIKTDVKLEDFDGEWIAESAVFEGSAFPMALMGEEMRVTIENGRVSFHEAAVPAEGEEEDEEPLEFTVDAAFENGALEIGGSEETEYVVLSLRLHEDGTLSAGYDYDYSFEDEDAEEEPEEEIKVEKAEDLSEKYMTVILFMKAEA